MSLEVETLSPLLMWAGISTFRLCSVFFSMVSNTTKQAPPLKRMRDLDAIAREQAKMMASEQMLFHAEPVAIQEQLGRECGRRIGENVTKGTDLHAIHSKMMTTLADKNNIMDRRFTWMGVGTAKASDGTLYLCQIFSD